MLIKSPCPRCHTPVRIAWLARLQCPGCQCKLDYDDSIYKVVIVVVMALLSPLTLGASAGLTILWPTMPLDGPFCFLLLNLLIHGLGTVVAFRRGWLRLYCKT